MNTTDFDYPLFPDGSQSPSAYSTTTTTTASPLTTESDADSGITNASLIPEGFDSTVINLDDFDIFLPNMDNPFPDDPNDDFNKFALEFLDKESTFENLFSSPINTLESQVSSSTTTIPLINNCIRLQTPTPIGTSIIKLDSIKSPIRLIPVVQPTTSSLTGKRRRAESPPCEPVTSTLTLNQLRAQYGNTMSEDALKKHLRMIKNRESASLSRKRRKEHMDNLDVENKKLTEQNEQLRRQNTQLATRIQALEAENELLKKYTPSRKQVQIMGIFLLVTFSFVGFRSFSSTNQLGNSMMVYDTSASIVPSRAILSKQSIDTYPNEQIGMETPTYPYMQCVAFINKTHSQRINRDLRSWTQTNDEQKQETKPTIIPDSKSVAVAPVIQRPTRKLARQIKIQSTSKSQLEPYPTSDIDYEDFFRTIERKNDTLYVISFKRDQLVLPALAQNQTQRPKMSLILPASMANLNKSIHVPENHIPMMKIDCEVDDTKLIFMQQSHIPSAYRDDLLQFYSLSSQASI